MRTTGTTFDIFHDDETEKEYEIQINWVHDYAPDIMYFSNGDPGEPGYSDITYNLVVIAIDGEPVSPDTEVPEWLTDDMITESLDLDDYDDDYND